MYPLLIQSILEGEFRFDVGFEKIAYSDYLSEKRKAFTQEAKKPVFLYTHNLLPGHSQNSGQCLPDETARHIERITHANEEMRTDLTLLIESRPHAIVIVAGDHGPYLTKNCTGLKGYDVSEIDRLDIQDRYGAFLSIKWPDRAYDDRYDIRILQDIFPALFAYLFEDDAIFEATRMERRTFGSQLAGAYVQDGIIAGGKDDGQPLFEGSHGSGEAMLP